MQYLLRVKNMIAFITTLGQGLVYIFSFIVGIILLYLVIRVCTSAWYKSKLDFVITQRHALNELLRKSKEKGD